MGIEGACEFHNYNERPPSLFKFRTCAALLIYTINLRTFITLPDLHGRSERS